MLRHSRRYREALEEGRRLGYRAGQMEARAAAADTLRAGFLTLDEKTRKLVRPLLEQWLAALLEYRDDDEEERD